MASSFFNKGSVKTIVGGIVVTIVGGIIVALVSSWFINKSSASLPLTHSGSGDIVAGDKFEFNGKNDTPTVITIEEKYENRKNSNGYETRYLATIVPSRFLTAIKFQVRTEEYVLNRLDVISLDNEMPVVGSGNDMTPGETNIRWKEYSNPVGRYQVTIYSNKKSNYYISFIPSPSEQVEIVDASSL